MEDLKKIVIIKELKGAPSLDAPRFNISYGKTQGDLKKWKGYPVINALKGLDHIIAELNSSLLNLPINQREDTAIAFIDELKKMDLTYRYRKITTNQSGGMLEQLLNFGKKNNTAHQIFVDIPQKLWQDEETIVSLLPPHGLKYYINTRPNNEVLDPLFNGSYTDDDILTTFKLVSYDCPAFCQMGIYTATLKLIDIKNLLGV